MSQFLVRFSIVMNAADDMTAAAEAHAALREGHIRKVTWLVTPFCPDCPACDEHHASQATEITTESPRVH